MVSDGVNRGFLLVSFNDAVKYLVVVIIMSVEVEVGMVNLWGKQETVFTIQSELLAGIQI